MAYEKTIWTDGVTTLSATNMQKIENELSEGWQKIAEQTLAGAVAQVDFASIPSGYKEFRLVFEGNNTTTAGNANIIFNNDTGDNYLYHTTRLNITPTGNSSSGSTSLTLFNALADNANRNYCTLTISNTPLRKKLIIGQHSAHLFHYAYGGMWANVTEEINKISIKAANGTLLFAIGSRFALWGCK